MIEFCLLIIIKIMLMDAKTGKFFPGPSVGDCEGMGMGIRMGDSKRTLHEAEVFCILLLRLWDAE